MGRKPGDIKQGLGREQKGIEGSMSPGLVGVEDAGRIQGTVGKWP